jgi:uncharacterized protein with HEPN domain
MKDLLADKARLLHIHDAAVEIQLYTQNKSFDDFHNDSMMLFASIKQLEIIGEAANQITKHRKMLYPEVQWEKIVGLRHILVHEYFDIDSKLLWNIIKRDVPKLRQQVEEILKQIQ